MIQVTPCINGDFLVENTQLQMVERSRHHILHFHRIGIYYGVLVKRKRKVLEDNFFEQITNDGSIYLKTKCMLKIYWRTLKNERSKAVVQTGRQGFQASNDMF